MAALTCQSFSPSTTDQSAYVATTQGRAEYENCKHCGGDALVRNVKGYYDAYGNKHYKYDCNVPSSSSAVYHTEMRSIYAPGCSKAVATYSECVQSEYEVDEYCDNGSYWDDSQTCVSCPLTRLGWTLDGFSVDGGIASDTCGYGTRNSGSIGSNSCVIMNQANGDACIYCDTTGCFELTEDCPYQA